MNWIASAANVYDGFLIQSRGSYGTAINSTSSASMPPTAHIRADVGRPVMTIESETDLFGYGFYPARQPDTDFVRTWELAGTAHQDQRIFDYVTAQPQCGLRAGSLPTTRTCAAA